MKVSKRFRDESKVLRVIESCLTIDHLKVARNMINAYCKFYNINPCNASFWNIYSNKYIFLGCDEVRIR